MRTFFLTIAFLFFSFLAVIAGNSSLLFEQANQYYSDGDYQMAATLYDSIIESGVVNKEVYFNLGNAYYKLGKTAGSILNFERALKLDPSDEDTKHNLNLANLRVVSKIDSKPTLFYEKWWSSLISLFSSSSWSLIALIFIWIAFGLGVLFLYVNSLLIKRLSFFSSFAMLFLCLVVLFLSYNRHRAEISKKNAIVTMPNVYVKSAPDKNSTDLFILHEGVKARITDQVNEWQKIQLSDGKIGWIKAGVIEVI